MSEPHKWAKEIKAWADGVEIQGRWRNDDGEWSDWIKVYAISIFQEKGGEFRIKPQPKEPQYLYVYEHMGCIDITTDKNFATKDMEYIGKIKLETDDD